MDGYVGMPIATVNPMVRQMERNVLRALDAHFRSKRLDQIPPTQRHLFVAWQLLKEVQGE